MHHVSTSQGPMFQSTPESHNMASIMISGQSTLFGQILDEITVRDGRTKKT